MMFPKKKQAKITTLLNKGKKMPLPDDVVELQSEIDELELQIKDRKNELFLLQRESFSVKGRIPEPNPEVYVRPQKIILESSIVKSQNNSDLLSMLTGMEVTSYVSGDHCSIVYHMQHDLDHEVKHGFRIEMKSGSYEISKSSLPLGFNIEAVIADHDKIMKPDCLRNIRTALVAYYDRLAQFEDLKKLVTVEAQLFKILDGSHIEITFAVQAIDEEDPETLSVLLILDYEVTACRPKSYIFKKKRGMDEGVLDALMQQCIGFLKKPLDIAFREAFMEDFGRYKLVEQIGYQSADNRRARPQNPPPKQRHDYKNDDTYLPEDCSEISYSE